MVEWKITSGLTPYPDALAFMEDRVAAIHAGDAPELIWLVEHPPLYTAGTSAKRADLIDPDRFDVFEARRGGEYTYHGPGQRVAYVMLNVAARGRDVRKFVQDLEAWIIATLDSFNDFDGIVPCGISQHGVTSLVDLGLPVTMDDVDVALRATFDDVFGDA